MAVYEVVQPLIVVRDDEGQQHMLYQGAVFSGEGLDKEHVKMLRDEGFIQKATAPKVDDDSADEKPTKVGDIVAAVGDDKGLAQQYLDEENAAEKPRKSLVEKLQAVLDAE